MSLRDAALKALEMTSQAVAKAAEGDLVVCLDTGTMYADAVPVTLPDGREVRVLASLQVYEPGVARSPEDSQ